MKHNQLVVVLFAAGMGWSPGAMATAQLDQDEPPAEMQARPPQVRGGSYGRSNVTMVLTFPSGEILRTLVGPVSSVE